MNITIAGAGNAAHTLMALLGEDHRVTVYAPLGDEAQTLARALEASGGVEARFADGRRLFGRPACVTANPALAGQEAEMLLLALPASAHESILRDLAPHLPARTIIGALPARGGFDWLADAISPQREGPIFGLQTLPWACRVRAWGQQVEVLGVKAVVDVAVRPSAEAPWLIPALSQMLALPLHPLADFLTLTLANMGQIIHPGVMYGLFHAWDGAPFAEEQIPLFYEGVDAATADLLADMSAEIRAVAAALSSRGLNVDAIPTLHQWLLRSYPNQIEDARTLLSSFRTNRAYAGLRAPVKRVAENAYIPWFHARYLAEDVPMGLAVSRGLADLADVATPAIDTVLLWAQEKLGKRYLQAG